MKPTLTYHVCVDWDATNWAATPDFSQSYDDISADVQHLAWSRGKDAEEGNAPAAVLEISIKAGQHAKYSPFTTGDLAGKIRPYVPVRVRIEHNSVEQPEYFGFLSRIRVNPHRDVQSVSLYCTDGLDLLARQLLSQNYNSRTRMSDGAAVTRIANVAGWSSTRRNIDTSGGEIFQYPQTGSY